jgi:hypothetical protein
MPITSSQDSLAVPPDQAGSRQDPGYRKLRRRLWLASSAVGAVGLVAWAVPALALGGSNPVVFHACVTNKTGAIRIVSASTNCAAGQHKIFWNQTGPTGPRGQRGLTGPKGPPGAAVGFKKQMIVNILLNASTETTVASLKLPAGKFIISAASLAGFSGTAPAVDGVQCDILSPEGGNAVAATEVNLNQDPGESVGNADVALTTAFTTSGGTMIFECMDSTAQASMSNTTLTAVQVNSLIVQS